MLDYSNSDFFHNAYIAMMSGIVKWKNEKEFIWKLETNAIVTIEFVNNSTSEAIIRRYYPNNDLWWKKEYKDGKIHGRRIGLNGGGFIGYYVDELYENGILIKDNKK